MKVAASWSGGKESCFACYKAISDGFEVSYLVNMITTDVKRSMTHGISSELLQTQSEAIGIPIIQRKTTWKGYEQDLKKLILELKQEDIGAVVFGDVDLQAHKDWTDRVCKEVGVEPISPLWCGKPKEILMEFIEVGFEAIVVAAKADLFDERWMGRTIDGDFVKDLRTIPDIHLLGESGEYHTFVVNGPIFKKCINIVDSNKIVKNGQRFLDILRYETCD
jgi:uncharacterized protein (TIGR00290 family)